MTRRELQDPMKRPTGWYLTMRRIVGGRFDKENSAFWERRFDDSYGIWIYGTGEVKKICEKLKDDLVLNRLEA